MDGTSRQRFLLPRSRRLTTDVLHFHRKVPLCPHDRFVNLGELDAIRRQLPFRVSMAVLLAKAYGLTAKEFPWFRQAFMPFPVASVYEHDQTVLMLAVAREHESEPWLFWGRFVAPEMRSLEQLQEQLTRYQTGPVESVFRQQLQLSALPTIVRRAIWWWNLNISGRSRARRTGTAFLSTLAGRGTEIQNPPSFQTGCLTYGPINDEGQSRVTLSYDHRLMDGATVAAALEKLDWLLNNTIAEELRGLMESAAERAA